MFRTVALRLHSALRQNINLNKPVLTSIPLMVTRSSHGVQETDEEFDTRFVAYFNKKDIDGWEVRKGMDDVLSWDLVPEPKIIIAALHACRRVNEYSVAIRFLEAVKAKCADSVNEIYPYIINEIQPTLTELGIDTPEQLGYDKPELFLESVHNM